MAAFLFYVLKSALTLALLVSLFMIFMTRETFHRLNRLLLLAVVVVSLLLPVVNIGVESPFSRLWSVIENNNATGQALGVSLAASPSLNSDVLAVEAVPGTVSAENIAVDKPFDWLRFTFIIYMVGVALLLVRQVVVYVFMARLILRSNVTDASRYGCDGVKLRVHNGNEGPFSWFYWVVVSNKDLDDAAREILTHESAHAAAGHSWDILFVDAVILLQWFNPFVWILKERLKDIHEFEADEAVINSGVNIRQYQFLIIKKAVGSRLYSIANSFNHSLTKKRITMMCKEKSKKWRCAKALYIVPVASVVALSFSTVETAGAVVPDSVGKVNEFVAKDSSFVPKKLVDEPVEVVPASTDVDVVRIDEVEKGEAVYQVVEQAPEFPGGFNAMMQFFRENIKYPATAMKAGKAGRAIVCFVVKKDGAVCDVKIVRSAGDELLDAEALRAVRSMPAWNPGRQRGKAVNVSLTIPVMFALEGELQANNGEPDKVYEFTGSDDSALLNSAEVLKIKSDTVALRRSASSMPFLISEPVMVFVNDELFVGELDDIAADNISSLEVKKIEDLSPGQQELCRVQGKKGALFVRLKEGVALDDAINKKHRVYQVVEQAPEFPGGMQGLMEYLNNNIKYPKAARDLNAQGRVVVQFVVMADGSIAGVKEVNSDLSTKYDNAAIAQLKKYVTHYENEVEYYKNLNSQTENDIKQMEKQYSRLEKDKMSEAVLKRRAEELEQLRGALEEGKNSLEFSKEQLLVHSIALEKAQREYDEVVSKEALAPEKLNELVAVSYEALKAEALRVVRSMPAWNPGRQGGEAVNVNFALPISFRLQ